MLPKINDLVYLIYYKNWRKLF